MYSRLARKFIIPLFCFTTRNPTFKYIGEMERSQWLSRRQIREVQNKRLRVLIRHAYNTVPYYRRIFRERRLKADDIKCLQHLNKLPILERSDVQINWKDMVSRDYPKRDIISGHTGGSTGEPLVFFTSKEHHARSNACRYFVWAWAGFEIGEKCAHIAPLEVERKRLEGLIKRRLSFNTCRWSETDMEKFVCKMVMEKPEVIYGNAMPVALMAQFIKERDIKGIRARSVIIDSNPLVEHEVEKIKRVFHCPVWWNYHNRENGTFASECSEHNGYHLLSQNFIFEFARSGSVVGPRETGSIVVTDLHNLAMPFIRYNVGDLGSYSDEVCPCGRGLPLMVKLQGRRCDILITETGDFVMAPFYYFQRFIDLEHIKQYRIVQETRSRIEIKIVPSEDYSENDTNLVRYMIHMLIGEHVKVDVEILKSTSKSKSGNWRIVERKFPINFAY